MTRENTRILNYDLLISHHNLKPKKKVILCLVQTGDKKACHVAIFIHSSLLSPCSPRQEGKMNENRDVTSFLVSRLNQALMIE